jgi:branched-chain amino acid transport system permease protein
VAYPATRLRSIYLALATFAFAEGARWVYASWDRVTGGANGLRLPVMGVFGIEIVGDRQAFPVIAALTALVILATMMITTSRFGRAMVAVRESEHVAMASGVDVRKVKVSVFALSALYAGLAGGIYALNHSFVSPTEFGFEGAVLVLSMIVVGGMGSIPGALLGVVLIGLLPVLLQTTLRSLQLWQELVYGMILTLAVMFMPRGVWGAALLAWRRAGRGRPAPTVQERRV